jgi:hypothetical protein
MINKIFNETFISMPTGFFIWGYMYPFTFIFGKFDRLYITLQKKKNGGTDTKTMDQTEPHFLSDSMSDRKKSFRQLCVIFTKNSMVHDLVVFDLTPSIFSQQIYKFYKMHQIEPNSRNSLKKKKTKKTQKNHN